MDLTLTKMMDIRLKLTKVENIEVIGSNDTSSDRYDSESDLDSDSESDIDSDSDSEADFESDSPAAKYKPPITFKARINHI